MIRPDDVLISVRVELVETLRQAQGERFKQTVLRRGQILMLVIYAKSTRDSLSGHVLKALREELENGID